MGTCARKAFAIPVNETLSLNNASTRPPAHRDAHFEVGFRPKKLLKPPNFMQQVHKCGGHGKVDYDFAKSMFRRAVFSFVSLNR